MLVKIFFEAMYASQHDVWLKYRDGQIRKYLNGEGDLDLELHEGKSLRGARYIPGFINRWRLRSNHISLKYMIEKNVIYFAFGFVDLHYVLKIK